jgi:hypothetical protein
MAVFRAMLEEPTEVQGPRGGRYIADGPVRHLDPVRDQSPEAFMSGRDYVWFRVKREGRYVRPRRQATGE